MYCYSASVRVVDYYPAGHIPGTPKVEFDVERFSEARPTDSYI